MRRLTNPIMLVPILIVVVLVGVVAYVLLAPSTWWKPVYVHFEVEDTHATAENQPPTRAAFASPTPPVIGFLPDLKPGQGIMYSLDTKVVNLAEPGGLRYLQTSIVVEFSPLIDQYYQLEGEERALAAERFRHRLEPMRPVIDDLVMSILSSKRFTEISTLEGKQQLKTELAEAMNEALGYQAVTNIYFTEFIVQ